mmetsp:Transcript_16771/g.34554  ORF Transcript_16771/g.34554 Transcript_16771/m.34554 type:complete len:377 (-) Transcript_16771:75-1205(-)
MLRYAATTQILLVIIVGLLHSTVSFTPTSIRSPLIRPNARLYSSELPQMEANGKTMVVAGATGYIGKSVVQEGVRQGYDVISLVRDSEKTSQNKNLMSKLEGSRLVTCDPTSLSNVESVLATLGPIDNAICCLASRSGVKSDAYLVDYQASSNFLKGCEKVDARHFTLLSAFCVKNPWLQFQQAKLKFEAELEKSESLTWSIVRPTAFFKSVSGQLEVIQSGAPFVMFGDGEVTRCNPIAERELAEYLVECGLEDRGRMGKIINLGGPDEPLTMKKQGEMLFEAVGKEPFMVYAPLWLFDVIIDSLQWLADKTGSVALEDAAETGRIGKYYAVEDMLTTEPEEKYGKITLMDHYRKIAVEGQEYDPYTTMLAGKKE